MKRNASKRDKRDERHGLVATSTNHSFRGCKVKFATLKVAINQLLDCFFNRPFASKPPSNSVTMNDIWKSCGVYKDWTQLTNTSVHNMDEYSLHINGDGVRSLLWQLQLELKCTFRCLCTSKWCMFQRLIPYQTGFLFVHHRPFVMTRCGLMILPSLFICIVAAVGVSMLGIVDCVRERCRALASTLVLEGLLTGLRWDQIQCEVFVSKARFWRDSCCWKIARTLFHIQAMPHSTFAASPFVGRRWWGTRVKPLDKSFEECLMDRDEITAMCDLAVLTPKIYLHLQTKHTLCQFTVSTRQSCAQCSPR